MSTRQLFLRYLEAYNRKDVTSMLSYFDGACVFENVSGGKVTVDARGKDELEKLARRSVELFATREQIVRSMIEGADRIAAEIEFQGLLQVELSPDMKAGSQLQLRGVSVVEFSGGNITRLTDYS